MSEQACRRWRVRALVMFPAHFPMPATGGLPERLKPVSRIAPQSEVLADVPVVLRPLDEPPPGAPEDLRLTWAELVADVEAPASQDAIELAMEPFELALESLSFQLQAGLSIHALEALDVTDPVAPGDEREMSSFPMGVGYPLRRYRPAAVQMGDVTELMPRLGLPFGELDDRQRAALDWYLKSLAAPLQMDRFIFLWIAAEILWTLSDVGVEGPYRADCGHEIPQCPTCGRTTSRQMRGRSLQRFFVEVFTLEDDVARELWRARQVLHGAEHFDSELIGRLDELTQRLRAPVNQALKTALGLTPDAPPHVAVGQAAILPHMGLLGRRDVSDDDLVGLAG